MRFVISNNRYLLFFSFDVEQHQTSIVLRTDANILVDVRGLEKEYPGFC